jgi:Protein of unknown function (DUF3016)
MRKFSYLLLLPILSLGFSAAVAAEPSNVRVDFVHPEHFTDFRIEGRDELASVPIFRDAVTSELSTEVSKRFPGQILVLRFKDIDLGGRLGNRPRFSNLRFNRQLVGPPIRLSFDYSFLNSKGKVVSSSSKSLLVQDYLQPYVNYPQSLKSSPVFYEVASLTKWIRGLESSNARVAQE